VKKALSGSRLRLLKGSTAILFSGTPAEAPAGGAPFLK
jgi:hypothetical protein